MEQGAQEAIRSGLQELLDCYVTQVLGRARNALRAGIELSYTLALQPLWELGPGDFVRKGYYERGIATSFGYAASIKGPMLR